jgi:hypothetical protein
MNNNEAPKPAFKVGDSVRLNLSKVGMQPSKDLFTIVFVQKEAVFQQVTFLYTIQSDAGKRFSRIAEGRLIEVHGIVKPKQLNEVSIETKIEERMKTSDYWIDSHRDYMELYGQFGDDEYKQLADAARATWEELFGKVQEREQEEA